MTDPDEPATHYTVTVSGKAQRLLDTLAEVSALERPGPLEQLGDLAGEAFARGLVELARERGLDVDRAPLASDDDETTRAARESATIAREAALLARKDHRGAMSRLAEAFPTLRGASGVRPWDPEGLDAWLRTSPAVTSGSRDAAAFVLGVWNSNAIWSIAFNAHRALSVWDRAHRAAFAAWASAPWWP